MGVCWAMSAGPAVCVAILGVLLGVQGVSVTRASGMYS